MDLQARIALAQIHQQTTGEWSDKADKQFVGQCRRHQESTTFRRHSRRRSRGGLLAVCFALLGSEGLLHAFGGDRSRAEQRDVDARLFCAKALEVTLM